MAAAAGTRRPAPGIRGCLLSDPRAGRDLPVTGAERVLPQGPCVCRTAPPRRPGLCCREGQAWGRRVGFPRHLGCGSEPRLGAAAGTPRPPWGHIGPQPVFVNQVLLEHSHERITCSCSWSCHGRRHATCKTENQKTVAPRRVRGWRSHRVPVPGVHVPSEAVRSP